MTLAGSTGPACPPRNSPTVPGPCYQVRPSPKSARASPHNSGSTSTPSNDSSSSTATAAGVGFRNQALTEDSEVVECPVVLSSADHYGILALQLVCADPVTEVGADAPPTVSTPPAVR